MTDNKYPDPQGMWVDKGGHARIAREYLLHHLDLMAAQSLRDATDNPTCDVCALPDYDCDYHARTQWCPAHRGTYHADDGGKTWGADPYAVDRLTCGHDVIAMGPDVDDVVIVPTRDRQPRRANPVLPAGVVDRAESAQMYADAVARHRAARGYPAPSDTLRLPALDDAVKRAQDTR